MFHATHLMLIMLKSQLNPARVRRQTWTKALVTLTLAALPLLSFSQSLESYLDTGAPRVLLFDSSVNPATASPKKSTPPLEVNVNQWVNTSVTKVIATGTLARDLSFGASKEATNLILAAIDLIGTPYKWGGESVETGFDCSGLVQHLYESTVGLILPRNAALQAKDAALKKIDKSELEPGDLVFFNTRRKPFSHVGIYMGEGNFIHAPRTGAKVRIEKLATNYWKKTFNGARRATLNRKSRSSH